MRSPARVLLHRGHLERFRGAPPVDALLEPKYGSHQRRHDGSWVLDADNKTVSVKLRDARDVTGDAGLTVAGMARLRCVVEAVPYINGPQVKHESAQDVVAAWYTNNVRARRTTRCCARRWTQRAAALLCETQGAFEDSGGGRRQFSQIEDQLRARRDLPRATARSSA